MAEKEVSQQRSEYFKSPASPNGYEREAVEFLGKDQIVEMNWRKPGNRYHIIYEKAGMPLEPIYFWLLNHLRYDLGFIDIVKITDVFAATESSAFFGAAQQKLGAQQDKVAQFLRVIHDIFKGLVLLVRDMRIIDEKLGYFDDSLKGGSVGAAAENTLKGQFIDMVEGGAKSPMSVLGLASQAQFSFLPELFFNSTKALGQSDEEFYAGIEKLDYSKTLRNVLIRKLKSYYMWKEKLSKELGTRRQFTLKYIRQQYDTVLLYMNWVKPYLKNIKRLQGSSSLLDTPDLIAGFDSSIIEIEIIGKAKTPESGDYSACIMLTLEYRTKPAMQFQQEPYHRGPLHSGEASITFRSYGWSDKEIEEYKKYREEEALELLAGADFGIQEAMNSIGEELKTYLEEAKDPNIMKKKEVAKVEEKKESPVEKFFSWILPFSEKSEPSKKKLEGNPGKAEGHASKMLWTLYKNFKKAHRMITW